MHIQLVQLMRVSGVTVVFAGLSPALRTLLEAHGVIRVGTGGRSGEEEEGGEADVVISRLDDALEYCEEQILRREKEKREDRVQAGNGGLSPPVAGLGAVTSSGLVTDTKVPPQQVATLKILRGMYVLLYF